MDQTLLPKHDAYLHTGVQWLGDIPAHWKLMKNKYLFTEKKATVGKQSSDYTLLSLTLKGVIARDMDNPKGKFPAVFNTYKIVNPNDLVFCLFDIEETPRTVGLAQQHGMITGAYTVIQCQSEASARYLNYYYLSLDFDKRLKPLYTGLRKVIQRDAFMSIKTPLPPHDEQVRIATFLDQKTIEIDEAIAKKQRLIELLKEQKAILINQAVTKGLNPDVPLRDSGVEWIGEVPAHWNIKKNCELFVERKESGSESLPILSVSLHTGVSDSEQDEVENIRSKVRIEDKTSYRRVYPGDIAFNMMRAWQGAIGVVKTDGQVSPAYIIANPCCLVDGEYFEYQYRTSSFIGQMDRFSKGITDFRKRLYWDEYKRLFTIIPPIDEQKKIIVKIREIAIYTDQVEEKIVREIELIREFRSILISSAVTGKIKI